MILLTESVRDCCEDAVAQDEGRRVVGMIKLDNCHPVKEVQPTSTRTLTGHT